MPRPKRALAEVDTNTEPATAAKKALMGRGKAKGKENEVPATKKAPVAKIASKKPTASRAKKATSKKTQDNETNSDKTPVPIAATMIQNALSAKLAASQKAKDTETDSLVSKTAPTVEVPDNGERADAEPAKTVAAAKSNDNKNDRIVLAKSNKSVRPSAPKDTTKASNAKKAATSSKATSKTKSTAEDEDGKVSRRTSGKTWICICRPSSEIKKEQSLIDDDEDEDDEDMADGRGKDCLCFKLADDHPEHKWIVTKKGFELMNEWLIQADKRCPDNFDMYIFNDFYGYGICEVIENMFLAFAKQKDKVTRDPLAMWSNMEGMVMFLRNCDLTPWQMIEDSGGNAKRIMLIGTALLTTIDVLIEKKLFTNSSKIRNIGLILSMFLRFAADVHELLEYNEDGWNAAVVRKADAHGVTIQGLVGIDELVEKIRNEDTDSDSDEEDFNETGSDEMIANYYFGSEQCYTTVNNFNLGDQRSWKHYSWEIELEAYRETEPVKMWGYGLLDEDDDIGGRKYDLTARRNKGPLMQRYKLDEGDDSWF